MKQTVLAISSRKSKKAEFQINDPVTRIGRGEACDVCINDPSVPDLALILEQKNGQFKVHNQTKFPAIVNGTTIKEKSFAVPIDTQVHIGRLISLELSIRQKSDDDSLRMRLDELHAVTTQQEESPEEETSSSSSKQTNQILAIILLLAIGGYLFMTFVLPKNDGNGVTVVTVSDALVECQENNRPKLCQRIQFAESAYQKGNWEIASRLYSDIRNDISASEGLETTIEFVSTRVEQSSQ